MRWTGANADKPHRCPCCHRASARTGWLPSWDLPAGRWYPLTLALDTALSGAGWWRCPVCRLRWHAWWRAPLWDHWELARQRCAAYPVCERWDP